MNRFAILENDLEFSRNLLNDIMSNNNKVRLVRLAVKTEELEDKLEKLEKGDILIFNLDIPDENRLELLDHILLPIVKKSNITKQCHNTKTIFIKEFKNHLMEKE